MANVYNKDAIGKLITTLSERIAETILADAVMEDFESELDEEIAELFEAAYTLRALDYPVPFAVQEVFRLHGECDLKDADMN